MSCCSPNYDLVTAEENVAASADPKAQELRRAGRVAEDGTVIYVFAAPAIHCGACIGAIERALGPLPGVVEARVNLTLRRVTVVLESAGISPLPVVQTLARIGFPATPVDLGDLDQLSRERESNRLLIALAIAGFAAANIMLLSVSVWSGADAATRDLFHLVSALIAIPTVAVAGQVFFRSAFSAVRGGRLNMDVPISLALLLSLGMSLVESLTGGAEAYFDAAVTLLFFLLVGRYLDSRMRERARSAVLGIARLAAKGATRIDGGEQVYVPLDEVVPGMTLRVPAGERIPVDGKVVAGSSDLDRSLVTGESDPVAVAAGARIEAGTLNISGSLDIEALTDARHSFLAEIMAMMEAAETGRGSYTRIADRMARLYAPVVHILAAATFLGWLIVSGGDWYHATYTAIAVLIVTCPCALGLAVPVVHVIGAARLFEAGILMKDGSALERLAEVDTVVFDKTGTLTTGTPRLAATDILPGEAADAARALAARSSHPASRAVRDGLANGTDPDLRDVREVPGCGIEAVIDGRPARLGRREWVAEIAAEYHEPTGASGPAFAFAGGPLARFDLAETLREGAVTAVPALKAAEHLSVQLLSGDAELPVERVATSLGVEDFTSGLTPAGKIDRIRALQAGGRTVLMVGDGLNDAPSLAAADVSMAPASACDAGRLAADFVFTRDSLEAVPFGHRIALKAKSLVRQNFGLAILYNGFAVPLAMAGLVTPLVAAIAMSTSSIVVVANSLRLSFVFRASAPGKAARASVRRGRAGGEALVRGASS
ncbi:heavy metal translocating P-type ATPase [Aurantimonas sp. VKM B-3413]|uniref:heavy metal translocating P-type ATPase n=1 Tax=Aurantimonas sp. VKM B-3413 TaxID=2779401 RepID=UPI001E4B64C2|nr:heavy metal translocating P-type ATPase [Aurantimonas sp. VKM B-3413]MCB8838589.1 cadmium-translocating P-type ATPase [Aurantimonas sp. VKM B-3413]